MENAQPFSAPATKIEVGRSIDEVATLLTPASDGSIRTFEIFEQDELCGFVAMVHAQRAK